MKVDCPFANECANYKKMCNKCRWNKALGVGDYLEFKKTKLVLLEEDGISTRRRLSTMRNVD